MVSFTVLFSALFASVAFAQQPTESFNSTIITKVAGEVDLTTKSKLLGLVVFRANRVGQFSDCKTQQVAGAMLNRILAALSAVATWFQVKILVTL